MPFQLISRLIHTPSPAQGHLSLLTLFVAGLKSTFSIQDIIVIIYYIRPPGELIRINVTLNFSKQVFGAI